MKEIMKDIFFNIIYQQTFYFGKIMKNNVYIFSIYSQSSSRINLLRLWLCEVWERADGIEWGWDCGVMMIYDGANSHQFTAITPSEPRLPQCPSSPRPRPGLYGPSSSEYYQFLASSPLGITILSTQIIFLSGIWFLLDPENVYSLDGNNLLKSPFA